MSGKESKRIGLANRSGTGLGWYVWLKGADRKWFLAATIYHKSEDEAAQSAFEVLRYFEGATEWRLSRVPPLKMHEIES